MKKKNGKTAMAAILFFKMSQKMTERKRYGLTVHCEAVEVIIREIQMFLKKNASAGDGNISKRGTTNQSTATKITHRLSPMLTKLP